MFDCKICANNQLCKFISQGEIFLKSCNGNKKPELNYPFYSEPICNYYTSSNIPTNNITLPNFMTK